MHNFHVFPRANSPNYWVHWVQWPKVTWFLSRNHCWLRPQAGKHDVLIYISMWWWLDSHYRGRSQQHVGKQHHFVGNFPDCFPQAFCFNGRRLEGVQSRAALRCWSLKLLRFGQGQSHPVPRMKTLQLLNQFNTQPQFFWGCVLVGGRDNLNVESLPL